LEHRFVSFGLFGTRNSLNKRSTKHRDAVPAAQKKKEKRREEKEVYGFAEGSCLVVAWLDKTGCRDPLPAAGPDGRSPHSSSSDEPSMAV
jgi:hypothetical protein